MTITLKISDNTKSKMIEYFEDLKREKVPPYAVFQAKEADTVITLYQSGKVVFQGVSADIDAAMWSEMEQHLNPNKTLEMTNSGDKKDKDKDKEKNNFNYLYNTSSIGSDEVGTGDYFGPVVVTASYVAKEDIKFLEEIGVDDSKKLNDDKILEIVPKFIKRIKHKTIILSNVEYNQVYSSDVNLNKIKAILHNRALILLTEEINDVDYIIVDQFAKPQIYYNYLKDMPKVLKNITFVTQAESINLSVACASLISRFHFIKEMDKLSVDLGINIPYGSSSRVNEIGEIIVNKFGFDKLNDVAKINFKNTEKIKLLIEEKK